MPRRFGEPIFARRVLAGAFVLASIASATACASDPVVDAPRPQAPPAKTSSITVDPRAVQALHMSGRLAGIMPVATTTTTDDESTLKQTAHKSAAVVTPKLTVEEAR